MKLSDCVKAGDIVVSTQSRHKGQRYEIIKVTPLNVKVRQKDHKHRGSKAPTTPFYIFRNHLDTGFTAI